MRITDRAMLEQSLLHLGQNQTRLNATQRMALSGEKVQSSSDDPVAYGQISTERDMLSRIEGYGRNISAVRGYLGATEAALQSFQGVLNRLRELTMMGLNEASRTEGIAVEAQQLYDQALTLANQTWNGGSLFAGYSAGPAFIGARFIGDNQKRAVEVSPLGATVFGISAEEAFGVLPGQDVFTEIATAISGMQSGNRAQMQDGLAAIDRYMERNALAQSSLGAQQHALTLAQKANEDYSIELRRSLGAKRDVDPVRVYSDLAADRYVMEATYSVIGSSSRLSILRYL